METGRVKETVRKRAVLKKIKKCRPEVLQGAEGDSQTVRIGLSQGDSCLSAVSDTVSAPASLLKEGVGDYIKVQIYDILNRVFADSAEPAAMSAVILMPELTEEPVLRFLMDCLLQVSEREEIEISDVKAECSPNVNHILIMLTIFGEKKQKDGGLRGAKAFLPEMDIVMMGAAALEGTVMLENAGSTALEQHFSSRFLEQVRELASRVSIRDMIRTVEETEPEAGVYCVGRSGIFGALWEIASVTGKGFSVDLLEIPIRQETIEICEFFDVNPYMLRSAGALLVAVRHGKTLADRCLDRGIPAAVIGTMKNHADKLVRNGEECRYLDMPVAVKTGQNIPEGLEWIY